MQLLNHVFREAYSLVISPSPVLLITSFVNVMSILSHHSSMVEHGDLSQTQASSSAQTDHVAECITAITDYRSNQISKWGAITQISAAISSAAATTNEEQWATARGPTL